MRLTAVTRSVPAVAMLGSMLAGALAAGAEAGGAGVRPNILFIMTDQQPRSCVGAYGNPVIQTPHIDTLARNGCVFTQFYISAFACSPSRACMLTGRYAHNHGVVQNDVLLGQDVPTLGDVCRSAGYRTAYFGKWHLGGNMYRGFEDHRGPGLKGNWFFSREPSEDGFRFKPVAGGCGEDRPQHGFETWAGGWKQYHDYLREVGLGGLLEKHPRLGNHNVAPSGPEGGHIYSRVSEEHHVDAFLAKTAERFIRDQASGHQGWCTVLSFYGPHLPVAPPKPWDTMYSLEQVTLPDNHRDHLEGKPVGQKKATRCYVLPRWESDQFKDYIRRYWGYCSFIDQQVGRVLAALRETNQWDRTIVVFTTDHGDMVGGHGMIFKLGSCGYEELYHVPAVVRIPGITKPGMRTDALVSATDLLPTLLSAVGVRLPEKMDGESLVPLLRGEKSRHRSAVFASHGGGTFICCDGRYKFVLNGPGGDVNELYDLEKDPGELRNLASLREHEEPADRMKQQILSWLRDTDYPYVLH